MKDLARQPWQQGQGPALIGLAKEVLLDSLLPAGRRAAEIADWMPYLQEAARFAPLVRIGNGVYDFATRGEFDRSLGIAGNGTLRFLGRTDARIGQGWTVGKELLQFHGRDARIVIQGATLDFGALQKISLGVGARFYYGHLHLEQVTIQNLHNENAKSLAIGLFLSTMRSFTYRRLLLRNIFCRFLPGSSVGEQGVVQGISLLSQPKSHAHFTDALHIRGTGLTAEHLYAVDAAGARAPRGGNALVVDVGVDVRVHGQIEQTCVTDTGNRAIKLNTYAGQSRVHIRGVKALSPWTDEDDARFVDASMWSVVSVQYGGHITIEDVTGVGGSIAMGVELGGTPVAYKTSGGQIAKDAYDKPVVQSGGEGHFIVRNLVFRPRATKTTRFGGTYAIVASQLHNGQLHIGSIRNENSTAAVLADNVKSIKVQGGRWEGKNYAALLYNVTRFDSEHTDFAKVAGGAWGVLAIAGAAPAMRMTGGSIIGHNAAAETPFFVSNTPHGPYIPKGTSRSWTPGTVEIALEGVAIEKTVPNLLSTDVPPLSASSTNGVEPVRLKVLRVQGKGQRADGVQQKNQAIGKQGERDAAQQAISGAAAMSERVLWRR